MVWSRAARNIVRIAEFDDFGRDAREFARGRWRQRLSVSRVTALAVEMVHAGVRIDLGAGAEFWVSCLCSR
jgi:hypothetical protein